MSLPQFADIISLSNNDIFEKILEIKNDIFNLRFKKATRQSFKSSDLKKAKRKLAQLKTLLAMRIEKEEK